jgi:hypothetical protein
VGALLKDFAPTRFRSMLLGTSTLEWNVRNRPSFLCGPLNGRGDVQQIWDVKDGQRPVEAKASEPQVFLHSLDACVSDVCSVDVSAAMLSSPLGRPAKRGRISTPVEETQQVQDGDERHDVPIHPVSENLLFRFCPFIFDATDSLRRGGSVLARERLLELRDGCFLAVVGRRHF